jgi:hypothetical protein
MTSRLPPCTPLTPVLEVRVRDLCPALVLYVGLGFEVEECCGRRAALLWDGAEVVRLVEDATLPVDVARGRTTLVLRVPELAPLRERARDLGVAVDDAPGELTVVDADGFAVRFVTW